MITAKRQYNKRIAPQLSKQKKILINHLRREWDEIEKRVRKEDMIRAAKAGGIAVGKGLLALLFIAGGLTAAMVAPNIFSAFGRMSNRKRYRTYIHRDYLEREIRILKKRNLVSFKKIGENEYKIQLTDSGDKKMMQKVFNSFVIPKADKWDGVWRMVIFDIPNKDKSIREGFREKLKGAGFYPLQKSVFVFPYPCEEELKFLAYIYNVGDCIRFIETSRLINDNDVKAHFGLP